MDDASQIRKNVSAILLARKLKKDIDELIHNQNQRGMTMPHMPYSMNYKSFYGLNQ